MELTTGMILFGAGIAGSIVCIVLFLVFLRVWKRQRKKMLSQIEGEE